MGEADVPDQINVLGVAGSLRQGSYNKAALRAAIELAPAGMTIETFDLAPIQPYNEDVKQRGFPPAEQAFREKIRAADALLFVTPEYNRGMPGVLKNAIDWASRPARASALTGKPVAIMGASPGRGGTARAQAQLRDGLTYTNGYVLPLPEVLVPSAELKFDADGNLLDEATRLEVRDLLVALAAWTRRLGLSADAAAAS